MNWRRVFRARLYIRDSLWVLPLAGALLGAALGAGQVEIDKGTHLGAGLQYSSSTAITILATIVGATAALTGFVVTVTTLVVQMATGTFSARYMRLWYRDRMLKVLLALLVGTLSFSLSLMRRVSSNFVPNIGVSVASALVVISLLVFAVFLDRYLHRLRPVAVAAIVADFFRRNFEREVKQADDSDIYVGWVQAGGSEPSLTVRSMRAGAVQAIDATGLVRWARARDCLVVICHRIGDFVPTGATLIEVYGGKQNDSRAEHKLRQLVALGDERTIEQDPAFAVRILVDIADLALSPAVNDPTSAVQVLDYLGDILRQIGMTHVSPQTLGDSDRPGFGVVIPARRWEDYLTLGVTEIREYGAASLQVMRRLRAMLEELRDAVTPEHRAAVEEELARLDATVTRSFGDSVDSDRAMSADAQGIGGQAPSDRGPALTR
ncbi:MAG: DUF2254 domain-containing protein [Solirubrobacteraceae bacterium]